MELVPQIHNDVFTDALSQVIRKYKPKTILDVGASEGKGSTSFFAETDAKVYALEIMPERFELLKELFKDNKKVYCYNYPASAYVMTVEHLWRLYRRKPLWDCFRTMGIFEMLEWRKNTQYDIDNSEIPNGILEIKRKHRIKNFGLACLDGGEWTGSAELQDVWGAKIIALDDVKAPKNYDNHKFLGKSAYKMVAFDPKHRNGFSIWIK